MKRFIRYYKWHIIFLLLVLVCLLFILDSSVSKTQNDMLVGYVGDRYVNTQDFNDNKSELELLLNDANNDKKRHTEILAYTADLQKDIDDLFDQMIDTESYHIYIASKETFKNYKNKDAFSDMKGFVASNDDATEVLKDSDGKVYAVSLEGNTLAERLGIVDTTDVYIAAACFDKDNLTPYEKNAINITGYIIENKQKYSY